MSSRGARLPQPQGTQEANATRWQDQAVCQSIDPELFFPEPRGNPIPAISICQTCPVRLPCLQAGLHEEYGVWGGLTEERRKQLRARMSEARRAERIALLRDAAGN